MNKNETKISRCKINAQKVSTFLKSREVSIAEDIPTQGDISIRQDLFSDSFSTIEKDDDIASLEAYHSSNFYGDSLQVSKKEEPLNAVHEPTSERTESLLQIVQRIAGRNTAHINQPPTGEDPSTGEESSNEEEPSSGDNLNEESARDLEPQVIIQHFGTESINGNSPSGSPAASIHGFLPELENTSTADSDSDLLSDTDYTIHSDSSDESDEDMARRAQMKFKSPPVFLWKSRRRCFALVGTL